MINDVSVSGELDFSGPVAADRFETALGDTVAAVITADTDGPPFVNTTGFRQTVVVVVGLPGVLLALLMFTIKEPERTGASAERTEGYSYRELWQFCVSRRKYLTYHFIGYLCLSIQGFAFLTWIVEFFVRIHGWTPPREK